MRRNIWTEDDTVELLKLNDIHTVTELASIFNRPPSSIRTKLAEYGRLNSIARGRSGKRLERLLLDDLTVFYWIGFILADGWITYNRKKENYTLGVSSSATDSSHIRRLGAFLEAPVYERIRSTNFTKDSTEVIMRLTERESVELVINKFGFNRRKSHNPPDFSAYTFSGEQLTALIIGFIDGDGTLITRKNGNSTQTMINLQLHSSWKANLEFVSSHLQTYFSTVLRSKVGINNRGHCVLAIAKYEMLQSMKRFILDNDIPAMERKWDKVVIGSHANSPRSAASNHSSTV